MRIYIFKADEHHLCAFTDDVQGSRLPEQFAPWAADGYVEDGVHPPHGFSRFRIESAIKLHGFQLWRMKKAADRGQLRPSAAGDATASAK
jgi:hypothetical protein